MEKSKKAFKMQNDYICFIDSGNGGKNLMLMTKKLMPKLNYLCVMDKKNAPYGNKSEKKLKKISVDIIDKIILIYSPRLIVVACNTLSLNCKKILLRTFPYQKFIFISPNATIFFNQKQKFVLFATKATNKKLKNCYTKFQKHLCTFVSIKNLALLIDNNINNLNNLIPILQKKFKNKTIRNTKNFLLGCTHFELIKNQINLVLPQTQIYSNVTDTIEKIKDFTFSNSLRGNGKVVYYIN